VKRPQPRRAAAADSIADFSRCQYCPRLGNEVLIAQVQLRAQSGALNGLSVTAPSSSQTAAAAGGSTLCSQHPQQAKTLCRVRVGSPGVSGFTSLPQLLLSLLLARLHSGIACVTASSSGPTAVPGI